MKISPKKSLRGILLGFVYLMGILGIVASGGGGGGGGGPVNSCGIVVTAIAPATDGSDDIWMGVLTKTALDDVNSVVRLNSDGSENIKVPVASGDVNIIRTVEIAVDGSNDVYVGGDFSEGIFRLNGDGSGDSEFNVGIGFNGRVSKITAAGDASGDVYVGGFFSDYNGTPVSGLVRLNPNGSLDNAGFIAAGASGINSIELATDVPFVGYIYTGGANGVDRWQNNGILDAGFNPPIGQVFTIVPAADASGNIYAGGRPTTGLVRLNSGGTVDGGFSTGSGFDSEIQSVTRADDITGDIYAGGWFTTYDGNPAMGIIRLNSNGSRDLNFVIGNGFAPSPNDPFASPSVESVALAANMTGDIFVGGGFSFYNGIASNGIVRLNNDGSRDLNFSVRISSSDGPCTDENYLGFDS